MPDCSHCGAHLEPGQTECPACNMTGTPTASFEPVGGEDVEGAQLVAESEGPLLIVRKGPQHGERFYLDRPKLTVGRDPVSDIFLNDMTVSRAHATLTVDQSGVTVMDAGSLNGTYVNGMCVDKATLCDGDALQIGTFQMVYHSGEDAS